MSGMACYKLIKSVGGGNICPMDTEHCHCHCSGSHPCRKGDECHPLSRLFGMSVCASDEIHCDPMSYQTLKPPKTDVTHSTGVQVCACSQMRPCRDIFEHPNNCVAKEHGGVGACPYNHELCKCDCKTDMRPCQHDTLDMCMATALVDGQVRCPIGSTMCAMGLDNSEPAIIVKNWASHLIAKCGCAGGAPCKYNFGDQCYQKQQMSDQTQVCPQYTRQCDCPCLAAKPCHSVVNGEDQCVVKTFITGIEQCPEETTECIIGTHSLTLDSNTPAPTPRDSRPCQWNGYSEWSTCTAECANGENPGGGTQYRLPLITKPARNGGACDAVQQDRACNTETCVPVDCVSTMSSFGPCSMNCGGGLTTSNPIVTVNPSHGGTACPKAISHACNTQACEEKLVCECEPQQLTPNQAAPGADSVHCSRIRIEIPGVAVKQLVTHIFNPPKAGYYRCGFSVSGGCTCCTCDLVECSNTEWGAWDTCTSGLQQRVRLLAGVVFHGTPCRNQTETQACVDE